MNDNLIAAKEMWHSVNKKFKKLDGSDQHFMLSIGWILGLVNNPGPDGKRRESKMLGLVDFERLLSLFKKGT